MLPDNAEVFEEENERSFEPSRDPRPNDTIGSSSLCFLFPIVVPIVLLG